MSSLKTSSTVKYDEGAGSGRRLTLETDSSPSLVVQGGQSYVRLFPSSANAKVTAVMGGATRVASAVTEKITDYVSFNGSPSASLRYVPTGPVTIEETKFFQSAPKVAYDPDSNNLIVNENAFGICRISYTATFDRYLVTHGDAPCAKARTQTTGGTPPDSKGTDLYYDPAFLVATAAGWETVSLEVAGPPCNQGKSGYSDTIQFNKYEPVGIKIEEDAEMNVGLYPFYFNATNTPLGFRIAPQTVYIGGQPVNLYAGCRIRVYPRVPVTLEGINCAVGASISGQGSKPVLEALTFSGSQSQGLNYPPSGVVAVGGTTNAIDLFGQNVAVQFRTPGSWVNEVEWVNANSYRIAQGSRLVREDEIVCTTAAGNNTIPCYTFAQVRYSSDYYLYDVLFNWDTEIGWYGPAMVLATDALGRVGSIELQPPGKGGVL